MGKRLGINERMGLCVQADNGSLGVSNVSGNVTVENDLAADEWFRDVGFVVAGNAVPPGKSRTHRGRSAICASEPSTWNLLIGS